MDATVYIMYVCMASRAESERYPMSDMFDKNYTVISNIMYRE